MTIAQSDIIAGFSNVIGCTTCPESEVHRDNSFNLPQPGFIGKNYAAHRVILLGQNPGASPERFSAEDKLYADLLLKLHKSQDIAAYFELYIFLAAFMRRWQVEKYFPLAESGLSLEDIAYFNLVRCRTRSNAVPSTNVTRACTRHALSWIQMLSPKVVVCIGKYSYDNISAELARAGIPCCFINRARNLNNSERHADRSYAASLVKNILSGITPPKSVSPASAQLQFPVQVIRKNKPGLLVAIPKAVAVKPKLKPIPVMDTVKLLSEHRAPLFFNLFAKLGFENVEITKVLKHRRPVPSIYFNRNGAQQVFFTAKEKDLAYFPEDLWQLNLEKIMQIKNKDLMPGKINIVPKPGKEEAAFKKLLGL
jgi:uracil-DNA glycosylase